MLTSRPPVFLLPGMLCDAAVWQAQIDVLQPHYRLMIPDFGGLDDFVAMAHHVLASAPPRFSLVAHSMGGRVAMEVVRLASERIDHIVLMDMGVHPVTEDETLRNQQLLELATRGGLAAIADNWIPYMLHPDRLTEPALINALRAMVLRNQVSDLRNQLRAAEQRADQASYLKSIGHKVHIVCGDSDNWNTPEQHRAMHAQLSDSELHILSHCGHMVPMEQPATINALLLTWLAGKSPAA